MNNAARRISEGLAIPHDVSGGLCDRGYKPTEHAANRHGRVARTTSCDDCGKGPCIWNKFNRLKSACMVPKSEDVII